MTPQEDPRPKIRQSIAEATHQLMKLRHISLDEALIHVQASYEEALKTAWGTRHEAFWKTCIDIVRQQRQLPRKEHKAPFQRILNGDEISHGTYHVKAYLRSGDAPSQRDQDERKKADRPWECNCDHRSSPESLVR
jgi:hypothetical protein